MSSSRDLTPDDQSDQGKILQVEAENEAENEPPRFSKPIIAPWSLSIPHEHIKKLMEGFSPVDMDDKWVIETFGHNERGLFTTYMKRSWTGYLITAVRFRAELDGTSRLMPGRAAKVEEITWESDTELFNPKGYPDPLDDPLETVKRLTRDLLRAKLGVDLDEET